MKKYFLLIAAAVAALAISSCKKDGDGDKKIDTTGGVNVAADNLVAYFPLNSEEDVITLGEGISYLEMGGEAEFNANGFRGGAYNNKSANHETKAYLKFSVPQKFLANMSSFTVTAWVNSPSQRGGIVTFDGGTDANWGGWDMFYDGGDDKGTTFKGYMFSTKTEWGGFFPNFKSEAIVANQWIQVGFSYDENTSWANLWVNGILLGNIDKETNEILGTSTCWAGPEDAEGNQEKVGKIVMPDVSLMYLGAFASRETGKSAESWLSYFAGKIDEVRIFNKALSAEEMLALYKAEVKVSDID
jgi:hypothetical protein